MCGSRCGAVCSVCWQLVQYLQRIRAGGKHTAVVPTRAGQVHGSPRVVLVVVMLFHCFGIYAGITLLVGMTDALMGLHPSLDM